MGHAAWPPVSQIIPTLRPLAVSALAGQPILLGWQEDLITPHSFDVVPKSNPGAVAKTVEYTAATAYYRALNVVQLTGEHMCVPTLKPRPKVPVFQGFSKTIRNKQPTQQPLDALDQWELTDGDRRRWASLVMEGKRQGPPKMEWAPKLKALHNRSYLLPKYIQLLLRIITSTLTTSVRLNRLNHPRAVCPHCQVVHNCKGMFWDCPLVAEVWSEVNSNLGPGIWSEWVPFTYNEVPSLQYAYTGPTLLHIVTLWSIWIQWCNYFYSTTVDHIQDYIDTWFPTTMLKVRDELHLRLLEAPSVVQWIDIVDKRRTEDDRRKTPEKEFLLTATAQITPNPDTITTLSSLMQANFNTVWTHPLVVPHRNKPNKLRFNYSLFTGYQTLLDSTRDPYLYIDGDDDDADQVPAAHWIGDY